MKLEISLFKYSNVWTFYFIFKRFVIIRIDGYFHGLYTFTSIIVCFYTYLIMYVL